MNLYLAGPMRRIPLYNFPLFHSTAAELRDQGHEVFNPADRDEKEDGFNPATDEAKSICYYMQHDLPAICRAEAVVVLPQWWESAGARLEVIVATLIGKPVLGLDMLPVPKFQRCWALAADFFALRGK